MSKIIRDIESINRLARIVDEELKKGKIRKARGELKLIIEIDIDELKRLQKEHGDKRLLEECRTVFKKAKEALIALDSFHTISDARSLISQIIKIEQNELFQAKENELESVEDKFRKEWEPEVAKVTYSIMKQFSHKTNLSIPFYPHVILAVHHRYPSGKISSKSSIPTCCGFDTITINEDSMYNKEDYAEEVGHFFRDHYRPGLIKQEKTTAEFFGFLARRIILEKHTALSILFGTRAGLLKKTKKWGRNSSIRKDALIHYRSYYYASKVDLNKIRNWRKLFSMPDKEVRYRFFRSNPDYSSLT